MESGRRRPVSRHVRFGARQGLARVFDGVDRFSPPLASRCANRAYQLSNGHRVLAWLEAPAVFLHVPKTGGVSVCAAFGLPEPGHLLLDTYPPGVRAALVGKTAFVALRDPVERFLSTSRYVHQLRQRGDDTFVRSLSGKASADDLVDCLGLAGRERSYFLRSTVEFVEAALRLNMTVWAVRTNSLQSDLNAMSDVLERKFEHLGRLNASGSRKGSTLSAASIARLHEVYEEDFRLWRRVKGAGGPVQLSRDDWS